MKIKSIAKLLLAAAIMQVAVACGGSKPVIDPLARLAYEQNASQENLVNLTKAYASYINKCRKTGDSEPGVYSEYAVLLLKSGGSRAEANSWFNKEMERYPSSRGYVMELKRKLIPEYQNNNSITTENASADENEGLSEQSRKAAEERASEVMKERNNELDASIKEAETGADDEEDIEEAVEEPASEEIDVDTDEEDSEGAVEEPANE
ncbi:MAG: DUF4810 domain-containing protein [Bacteroidales bacterium]|jgi:hypothetical protein|nr:DUF4810 domain-containing protein [Bacteroidales bacterium]